MTVRVLVVDDDFAVASLHRAFVTAMTGFTVVGVAHTGADALAATTALRPDLVLLDIYLPDMTGLEVLHELRTGPPVDVLVITAAREVETVRTAMAGGVLHYLIKPFTRADLHARLADYHTRQQLVRQTQDDSLDQERVDQLLSAGRPATAARLPKGLAERTMVAVRRALQSSDEPLSAEAVAHELGMSRVAARRYLEHLVTTGVAGVQPEYGQAGRPRNLYSWSVR